MTEALALLDINQVAEFLQIKRSTLYDWVHHRKIQYVKIGGTLRFKKSDILNLIDRNTKAVGEF